MNSYEILEKALSVIEDPNRWTRGALWDDGEAGGTRFCAIGALIFAAIGDVGRDVLVRTNWASPTMAAYHEAKVALERGSHFTPHMRAIWEGRYSLGLSPHSRTVEIYNDHGDHAQVVHLFKKAIRAEKTRHGVSLDLRQQSYLPPTASENSPEPVLAHV